jgi:superfamily I DNA/RNA helicase
MKENQSEIPGFEHILVDEYQDVNAMQIELIKLLNVPDLFAVGDPRQSIFGWRGSSVNYILNFEKDHSDVEIIHLTKNYRSSKKIVDFMNSAISEMGLPDLAHHRDSKNSEVKVIDFENEDSERAFVIKDIIDGDVPNEQIFVLARTNRQLMELSRKMKERGINHVVKTDEVRNPIDSSKGDVTLATVHAIKGLQAKKVFVIGVNEQNFPCKASDHPAIEMIKTTNYDKEEEERRLLYVAISRAKKFLYVTYSGKKPSYFISDEMYSAILPDREVKDIESIELIDENIAGELKAWRMTLSEERGVPAYTILANKTIDEIAKKAPRSAEELANIDGIGPSKLMKYGGKILDIVGDVE